MPVDLRSMTEEHARRLNSVQLASIDKLGLGPTRRLNRKDIIANHVVGTRLGDGEDALCVNQLQLSGIDGSKV